MRSNKTACFLALAALCLLPSLGCQKAKDDGKLRIAVIPKGTTHEFWKSVHYGAEQAAKELGNVEILWKGPLEENDRPGQIRVMRDFITKRVDGICLAPLDRSALVDYVDESVQKDIPVVIFDSGLDDETNIVSYIATNNYHGGELAAEQLVKAMGGEGDVILLRYSPGSESTEERERGFLDKFKEMQKDNSKLTILSDNQYAGTTPKESQENSIRLIGKYKAEVDGVFAVCEPNAAGVLLALDELELLGKVKFVAFDPNADLVKGLESGSVHGIVLQDPVKMGYEAVKAAVGKINGTDAEKRIVTGESVATPENYQTEEMQRLLHPPKFDE